MKSFQFEVRAVPLETYPDLIQNSANPYTQMTEDDRLEELIEILGLVWAETCLERARGSEHDQGHGKPEQIFSCI